jgi:hypothetical protein
MFSTRPERRLVSIRDRCDCGGVEEAVEPLRVAAVRERLGEIVGSDELIVAAVQAVVGGVPGTALERLAGLTRIDEPEAHDLFEEVLIELALPPETVPAGRVTGPWERVHWWCRLIVEGGVLPEDGGHRIWLDGSSELGHPDALEPIVTLMIDWEDWSEVSTVTLDTYRGRIVDAAALLLELHWPDRPPLRNRAATRN